MPSIVCVPTMLSVSGRDSISASPLGGALWLFRDLQSLWQAAHLHDRQWQRLLWILPAFEVAMDVSSIPRALWFRRAAFVMRDGFEMSRPELLRTFKCLVDQWFHITRGVHMRHESKKITRMSEGGGWVEGECYGTHPTVV